MNVDNFITDKVKIAVESLYGTQPEDKLIQIQKTNKEFEGDVTLVTFPLLKTSRKSPEQTANEIGEWLKTNVTEIE